MNRMTPRAKITALKLKIGSKARTLKPGMKKAAPMGAARKAFRSLSKGPKPAKPMVSKQKKAPRIGGAVSGRDVSIMKKKLPKYR